MIKKLTLLIFIVFSLTNCGYSPMYSDNSNTNFEVYNLELEGNSEVNSIIKKKIEAEAADLNYLKEKETKLPV